MKSHTFRLALLALLVAEPAGAAANLPQKAFTVEDGIVAVSAGVMPNRDAPAGLPIGKLKYPTRYFVQLTNESPYPIWLDAVWVFPDNRKGRSANAKPARSTKVPSQGGYWFYVDKLGVVSEQPILIDIKAWSDEKRSRLAGSQAVEMYFQQASIDRFLADFPGVFKRTLKETQQAAVLSGLNDVPPPRTDVPGTATDGLLQTDIQWSIWKADSLKRWSCERQVVAAATLGVDESRILSGLPDVDRDRARQEYGDSELTIERWSVRSCGQDLAYEVLLSASSSGGTDLMIVEVIDPE